MKTEFIKIKNIMAFVRVFWEKNNLWTFLILHWWGGSSDSWFIIAEMLEKKWFKVLVPDLPWHWETWLDRVYDLDNYWDFVLEIIKKFNLKNFNLLAHSNWWRISLKLLIGKKINPKNTFLVWPAWIRPVLTFKQKIFSFLAKIFKFLKWIPWVNFFRSLFYRIIWWQDYLNTDRNKYLKQTFLNVLEIDLSDRLWLVKNKIELIWWDEDSYTPLYLWKKMSKLLQNCNLTVLKWEKHWIHLQNPKLLFKTIIEKIC